MRYRYYSNLINNVLVTKRLTPSPFNIITLAAPNLHIYTFTHLFEGKWGKRRQLLGSRGIN